jgi:hypothetical protein
MEFSPAGSGDAGGTPRGCIGVNLRGMWVDAVPAGWPGAWRRKVQA